VNYYFTCDVKVNIYTYLERDNNFRTSQQGNVDYILGMEGAFYLVYSFILMTCEFYMELLKCFLFTQIQRIIYPLENEEDASVSKSI
jgi:hypothetical protein